MNKPILRLIDEFNHGWTSGKPETLAPLLHDEVVFVAPDLKTRIRGKLACIDTIREYGKNAETLLFQVKDKDIQVWGSGAVVSLDYYIEYQMNQEHYKEKGKEFWTLTRENKTWQLVWRAMVSNEVIED
jgi:hypothetical protein